MPNLHYGPPIRNRCPTFTMSHLSGTDAQPSLRPTYQEQMLNLHYGPPIRNRCLTFTMAHLSGTDAQPSLWPTYEEQMPNLHYVPPIRNRCPTFTKAHLSGPDSQHTWASLKRYGVASSLRSTILSAISWAISIWSWGGIGESTKQLTTARVFC